MSSEQPNLNEQITSILDSVLNSTPTITLAPQPRTAAIDLSNRASRAFMFALRQSVRGGTSGSSGNGDGIDSDDEDDFAMTQADIDTHVHIRLVRGAQVRDMCAVCRTDFKMNRFARMLKCGHIFHKECVDPWLQQKGECPTCKGKQMS